MSGNTDLNVKPMRLGVIGLSEGNGHPYSWSAIINGYDAIAMADCDFPVIPIYLAKETWPAARIPGARVTHIWTQDTVLSEKIARATHIDVVVDRPQDMLSHIDGVLLARDDAENHLHFGRSFLEAGIPVYFDKPIALSLAELDVLYSLERFEGQIFTCSALRYARELQFTDEIREAVGTIKEISATTPKSWDKYAVHIIEPVLAMLDPSDVIERVISVKVDSQQREARKLSLLWRSGVTTHFSTLGNVQAPITVTIVGSRTSITLEFGDTFAAFRAALSDFVSGVSARSVRSPRDFNTRVVSVIEAGRIT